RAPFGLSDWAQPAALGEETAFETAYTPPPAASSSGSLRPGQKLRLWLQRAPVPADRRVTSITLPDLPGAKIAGLTLGYREGFALPGRPEPAPPEPAPVAIFAETGFPRYFSDTGLTAERIRAALERGGIASSILGLDHLLDPEVLDPARFPVLVQPYGNTFPVDAADALREYRRRGGAMVHCGVPFTHPTVRTSYGNWLDLGHSGDFAAASAPRWIGGGSFRNTSASRISAVGEGAAWGLEGLPWPRLEPGDLYGPGDGGAQVLDAASFGEGAEVIPLIVVGGDLQAPWSAAVKRTGGEFASALDVWTASAVIWLEAERPLTRLHVELMARGAAWCLRTRGLLSEEEWKEIARPLTLEDLAEPLPEPVDPAPELSARLPSCEVTRRRIFAVSTESLAPSEKVLLASAQGLLNRRGADALYLIDGAGDRAWLEHLRREEYVESLREVSPRDALDRLGHRRSVLVDPDLYGSLNLAAMIASVEEILVAYPGDVDRYRLEPVADLRGLFRSGPEMTAWAIENVLPRARPGILASWPPVAEEWRLLDYLVAQRLFTFWLPAESERSAFGEDTSLQRELVDRLLASTPAATAVIGALGSGERGLGRPLLTELSRHGKYFVSLEGASNLSFSSSLRPRKPLRIAPPPRPRAVDPEKIYVAFSAPPITPATLSASRTLLARTPTAAAPARSRAIATARLLRRVPVPAVEQARAAAAPASAGVPPELVGRALHPAARDLLPVEVELALKASGLESPTGLDGPGAFLPDVFGSAWGSRRPEVLAALLGRAGSLLDAPETGSLCLTFETLPAAPLDDSLLRLLPEGTGIFCTAPRAQIDEDLVRSALEAPVPIFQDITPEALRSLLSAESAGSAPLAPRPLFLHLSSGAAAAAEREGLLGDPVVVVSPAELALLARDFGRRHRLEALRHVAPGAVWKYNDRGEDLGAAWRAPSFDDAQWAQGHAELGYGDGDETTALDYGEDDRSKRPCYYFRRRFTVEGSPQTSALVLEALVDDGCAIYIGGIERLRHNLPEGDIGYSTSAIRAIGGSDESRWIQRPLSADILVSGENTIAVEVHQSDGASSDLSFDLKLTAYRWAPREAPPAPAAEDAPDPAESSGDGS
ncbi:MAG: hypothetical protein JXA90_02060, partial [Planctomycetes bacterium]|nr:hypothetical protein [Planctomycetota bacterium]